MPTKYVRETDVEEVNFGRATPFTRLGPIARPMSQRQRFFMLVMGVAIVVLLVQIAATLNSSSAYFRQPVQRGTGTVIARGDHRPGAAGEAGAGRVTIEVAFTDKIRFTADREIPDPYWEALQVGSKVAVLYQINKLGTEMRLFECGVVALPEKIR